jgi:hypothetical protein
MKILKKILVIAFISVTFFSCNSTKNGGSGLFIHWTWVIVIGYFVWYLYIRKEKD